MRRRDPLAAGAKPQAAFDSISAHLRVTTPQQFAEFTRAENQRWGGLIRRLGIKADRPFSSWSNTPCHSHRST